jgi:hypothetical protein
MTKIAGISYDDWPRSSRAAVSARSRSPGRQDLAVRSPHAPGREGHDGGERAATLEGEASLHTGTEEVMLASRQVTPHYYDTLNQDIGSGKVVYDGAKARACFDAANAVSACHRTGAYILHLDPNCTSIFTGTVLANRLDGIALAVDPGELSIP